MTIRKYELCFVANGGGDTHIQEIEAEGYDDSYMGQGDGAVPSVAFEREEEDPEDSTDTMTVKVFELPAHRVVYIRLIDEPVAGPDGGTSEVNALTKGEPLTKEDLGAMGEG
jgi:hypothetical protein